LPEIGSSIWKPDLGVNWMIWIYREPIMAADECTMVILFFFWSFDSLSMFNLNLTNLNDLEVTWLKYPSTDPDLFALISLKWIFKLLMGAKDWRISLFVFFKVKNSFNCQVKKIVYMKIEGFAKFNSFKGLSMILRRLWLFELDIEQVKKV